MTDSAPRELAAPLVDAAVLPDRGAGPVPPRGTLAAAAPRRAPPWQRILAALAAHARRQVALALGERVDDLNQAIRNGAEARRQIETRKEKQP
jgi:hypothetical protein